MYFGKGQYSFPFEQSDNSEITAIGKRFYLDKDKLSEQNVFSIVYSSQLPFVREATFLFPSELARTWKVSIRMLLTGLRRQSELADRRMIWLKKEYVRMYYTYRQGPSAANAVRIFGGRRWSITGVSFCAPSHSQQGGLRPPNGNGQQGQLSPTSSRSMFYIRCLI